MRFYGNTYRDAASKAAEGARTMRELALEAYAIEKGLSKGWGIDVKRSRQGRHSELDPSKYLEAVELIKSSPSMLFVRDVMKTVEYKTNAQGREKFLRNLFPFDPKLFTSDDDMYVGYLGKHDEEVIQYDEDVANGIRKTKRRR